LLPLKDGKPCIFSAMNFLARNGAERIIVVVSPNSVIPHVLSSLWVGKNIDIVVQDIPHGVCDAIRLATSNIGPLHRICITFCDNVYNDHELVQWHDGPYGTVRNLARQDLDGWEVSIWKHRAGNLKLAGHVIASGEQCKGASGNITQWLNMIIAVPKEQDLDWHDIGTLEAYMEYWK